MRSLWLRHVAKRVGVPLLYGSGALWLANRLTRNHRQIALNYHNVDPDVFGRHIVFLRRHATLVDLETFLAGGVVSGTRPTVTITFDDGYASFVQEIIPIVSAFSVPVAWFVPTAVVGTSEIFWFNRVRERILHSRRGTFEFEGHQWRLRRWNREYVAAAISRLLKQQPSDVREPLCQDPFSSVGRGASSCSRPVSTCLACAAESRRSDPCNDWQPFAHPSEALAAWRGASDKGTHSIEAAPGGMDSATGETLRVSER